MNAAVAVFKWVNKYKAIGDSRSFNDGWNTSTLHGAVGFEQPFHQFRNLLRLRTLSPITIGSAFVARFVRLCP